MKDDRERNYLNFLSENQYVSSEDITLKLDISGRTVRNELKELNQVLEMHGAKIVTKTKHGSILMVEDRKAYQDYLYQMENIIPGKIPKNSYERVGFLMGYLLQSYSYIKIENLCDLLYVSKTSLSLDLKQVREQLQEYNLKLNSKSNHGIKVEGSEFDLRLCMAKEGYSLIYQNTTAGTVEPTTSTTTGAAVTVTAGWAKNTDGTWNYIKADGTKATGWFQDGAAWYYLKADGVMATGWVNYNGTWYYCNASGAMLANTTVDGYVLGDNGAWSN